MAVPGIVAHLDLDAFFAAVEELENPELRAKPLIVGGDPHGRGVVATANYVARALRDPLGDERGRGDPALPAGRLRAPAAQRSTASTRATCGRRCAGSSRRVEQTGIDEGYLDVGEVARDFLEARVVAEAVQTAVRAATSLTCSLGVAPCKVVAKVGSDARKPGGLTVVVPGQEASFLAPFDVRRLPGRRAEGRAAAARRRRRHGRRARRAHRRRAAPAAARKRRHGAARPRARRRPARARARRGAHLDQRREHVRARPRRPRAAARRAARDGRARSPSTCSKKGQIARTVTTKLRYADFSIRSRSTSLDVGIDDAGQIGDARLPAARPRPARPAGRAPPRRRRRLGARGVPAARRFKVAVTTGGGASP